MHDLAVVREYVRIGGGLRGLAPWQAHGHCFINLGIDQRQSARLPLAAWCPLLWWNAKNICGWFFGGGELFKISIFRGNIICSLGSSEKE